MSPSGKALIRVHAAVLLFGFAGLFGKWITMPAAVIVFWRVVFASLALAAVLLVRRKPLELRAPKGFLIMAACGFLLAVHWASFFRSIQVSTVAVGLLSYATFPVFVVFLEPVLLGTKLERKSAAFAVLCLAGVYLIVPAFSLSETAFVGVLWGILSSVTFALLTLANRRLSARISSLEIALFQDLAAALFLAPLVLKSSARPGLTIRNIALLAVLGVVCTALAHTLFISGLKWIRASTAGILCALEPAYGIILAALLLGEIPGPRTIIGGLVILFSAAAATLSAAGRGSG
jgi:drug/metabolite transporter (DMT)-like permease